MKARKPAGWKVERTPPPPVRREGRASDPEAAEVVAEAVRTGQWLSKVYDDMGAAKAAVRRIRHRARKIDPRLRVESRRTPEGARCKLSIRIIREGNQP